MTRASGARNGPRIGPRIGLIHAVTVAMEPISDAFAEAWPEAECVNILDDSLSPDRARDVELTADMSRRIAELGNYAIKIGCHGILYTCSAFGTAIEAVQASCGRPVLKPNEAMFEQALSLGGRIGMLATFGPSVAGMEEEFRHEARKRASQAEIVTELVPEAMSALKAGDADAHNRMLADRASRLDGCDAIVLAHFSTARAAAAVRAVARAPVIVSPQAAVAKLRQAIEAKGVVSGD